MSFCLDVKGDFACFTRPEMKVERVSYDVITPSAARAIFESILWKPAIIWRIHTIEVLAPIRWVSVRRNELGAKVPVGNIKKAMNGGALPAQFIEDERQQRAGLFLRDVHYRIDASFALTERAGPGDSPEKFASMFTRRARKGQCVNQPYLGCREFAADVSLCEDQTDRPSPIAETKPLGWMLYDLNYEPSEPTPLFFNASMENGVVTVPEVNSAEVRG